MSLVTFGNKMISHKKWQSLLANVNYTTMLILTPPTDNVLQNKGKLVTFISVKILRQMLYCRAQCFCRVLCLPSLIWLDANKTCFHQPGALLGPQQCLPHLPPQVRVPVAQSMGEQVTSRLQKAISLSRYRQNFVFLEINWGHGLLCRHAPCPWQYGRSC